MDHETLDHTILRWISLREQLLNETNQIPRNEAGFSCAIQLQIYSSTNDDSIENSVLSIINKLNQTWIKHTATFDLLKLSRDPSHRFCPLEQELIKLDTILRSNEKVFVVWKGVDAVLNLSDTPQENLMLPSRAFHLFESYLNKWATKSVFIVMLVEDPINPRINFLTPLKLQISDFREISAGTSQPPTKLELLEKSCDPSVKSLINKLLADLSPTVASAFIDSLNIDINYQKEITRIDPKITVKSIQEVAATFPPLCSTKLLGSINSPLADKGHFGLLTSVGKKGVNRMIGRDRDLACMIESMSSELGILLTGESKRCFVSAVCEELHRPYVIVTASDVFKPLVGETEKYLASIAQILLQSPSLIVVLDGIDQWIGIATMKSLPQRVLKSIKDIFIHIRTSSSNNSTRLIGLVDNVPPELHSRTLFNKLHHLPSLKQKLLYDPHLIHDILNLYLEGRRSPTLTKRDVEYVVYVVLRLEATRILKRPIEMEELSAWYNASPESGVTSLEQWHLNEISPLQTFWNFSELSAGKLVSIVQRAALICIEETQRSDSIPNGHTSVQELAITHKQLIRAAEQELLK